jgi:ribonuclease P protein component
VQNEDQKAGSENLRSAFCTQRSALSFPRSHRLSGKLAFAAVYDTKQKVTRGPLAICYRANGLPHHRLGLSVPRRVGSAPKRNRIKRLLREAFRLHPKTLESRAVPGRMSFVGCDLVINVRPHPALLLEQYQALFAEILAKIAERSGER